MVCVVHISVPRENILPSSHPERGREGGRERERGGGGEREREREGVSLQERTLILIKEGGVEVFT